MANPPPVSPLPASPLPASPLPAERLNRQIDPARFSFASTADLPDPDEPLGQDRAIKAIKFGIGMQHDGYNMFVLGPPGSGRHGLVRGFLDTEAAARPAPEDWCYVNNFETPHKPKLLRLAAGMGRELRRAVEGLIEELRTVIPAVFEAEDYRNRHQIIDEEFKDKQETVFEAMQKRADGQNIALVRTPMGLAFAPMQNGEVIKPELFKELPEAERDEIEKNIVALQGELEKAVQQFPQWDKERRQKLRDLNRDVTEFAVSGLIESLCTEFAGKDHIEEFLADMKHDIIANVAVFLVHGEDALISDGQGEAGGGPAGPMGGPGGPPGGSGQMLGGPMRGGGDMILRRYQVNLLVDNSDAQGAPVISADHPTVPNLIGRIEHMQEYGALIADFGLIKPGDMHRANGGFLIIDAVKLLTQPLAWDTLKQCLRSRTVKIESLAQLLSMISTISLEPEPIPLDVKVVLVGERQHYYLLSQLDPDFGDLFKVAADLEDDIPRADGALDDYASVIAMQARHHNVHPLDPAAVARVLEHSGRLAGDSEKLSANAGQISDLLREANYWAEQEGRELIGSGDVQCAIDAQIERLDRIRDRSQEMIERGIVLVDLAGAVVGQINGLAVLQVGQFAFGKPSRITANVRIGRGEVIDIEREAKLGGPTHTKGVMILSSFLSSRFAVDQPLSLSASLVFEQSYGGIDGDSASSTELYALLSALSGVPIKQCFAVTGSVNQHGRVQAIGGANEKIEGFFDLCKTEGLTGEQGVLIPAANVVHLMLRRDVVDAVRDGKFNIYPIETIDQGIALLTGVPAGEIDEDGTYPEGTINRLVADRLAELAQKRRSFNATDKLDATDTEDKNSV